MEEELLFPLSEGGQSPSTFQTFVPLTASLSLSLSCSPHLPPTFSLGPSLPWLSKPSLTQHTKLKDKQRRAHREGGGEQFFMARTTRGLQTEERRQSCPL